MSETPRLTPMQAEVERMMAHGLSYREMADQFGISPLTVKNHAVAVYDKVGARSMREVAARYWQRRIRLAYERGKRGAPLIATPEEQRQIEAAALVAAVRGYE